MSNIVNLKDVDELEKIIGNDIVKLGDGIEGITYLSKKDNKAYKILTTFQLEYKIKNIITVDDIDLKYFLLPEELYVYDNHLIAYRTKYINKNLLDINNKDNNIFNINLDKFLNAYKNFLTELRILSNNKIKTYDIGFNLMYDGENLYAIDTCGYRKVDEDVEEVYKYNKQYLDNAIKDILAIYLISKINIEKFNKIVEIEDLEQQLNEIKTTIKR